MQPRHGAGVVLSLLVAAACVGDTADPSSTLESPTNTATPPSSIPDRSSTPISSAGHLATSPTPIAAAPGGTSEGTALALTTDPSLESGLPDRMGDVRFVRHSLVTGAVPPFGFTDELGRALLDASGASERDLAVAWIDPVPEDVAAAGGLTLVAVRIRGASAADLRQLAAVDRLLAPGVSGYLGFRDADREAVLLVGDTVILSSRNTLYIVSFPAWNPDAPRPTTTSGFDEGDLFAALPAIDSEVTVPQPALPPPPPLPSFTPSSSPRPDPEAEALLPDRIRDAPVAKVSATGLDLFAGEYIYLGLPAFMIFRDLGLDPVELSAAGGHPEGLSTFWIVATRLPGFDSRTILTAWFERVLESGWEFETVGVDGRTAVVYGGQAVHAADGVLYWMTYLDLGDFPPASPAPRPAFRDLVLDTLEALP